MFHHKYDNNNFCVVNKKQISLRNQFLCLQYQFPACWTSFPTRESSFLPVKPAFLPAKQVSPSTRPVSLPAKTVSLRTISVSLRKRFFCYASFPAKQVSLLSQFPCDTSFSAKRVLELKFFKFLLQKSFFHFGLFSKWVTFTSSLTFCCGPREVKFFESNTLLGFYESIVRMCFFPKKTYFW